MRSRSTSGAPTRWGRLSYAVRWHSGRPALLWDLGAGSGSVSVEWCLAGNKLVVDQMEDWLRG